MTYNDLLEKVAEANNVSKAQADRVIKSTIEAIQVETQAGRSFRLPTLGTFSLRFRKERNITDPAGNKHVVAASNVLHFSPSKDLKEAAKTSPTDVKTAPAAKTAPAKKTPAKKTPKK
jgi:nucleoid DNA-binding protein